VKIALNGMLPTLPDILSTGLRVVFVGINPSVYSVERGHYFARPTNRFWPAFSKSTLSASARKRLTLADLGPENDVGLLEDGFGFTDVVKLPTSSASELRTGDFAEWAPRARSRIEHSAPEIACFQGPTALRPFLRHALDLDMSELSFGLQRACLGPTRIFLTPNPSPANARYRLDDLVGWFDALAGLLARG
jgi:TDG/mug DNA glycosylase family protein